MSTLCDPRDCSPPGSSVHGISQARILGVGFHFLLQGIFPIRGASPHLLCILPCRWIFYLLGHLSSRWPQLRVRQNFRKKTAILVPLETARSRLGYRARELRGTLAVPTSTRLHRGGSSVPTQGYSSLLEVSLSLSWWRESTVRTSGGTRGACSWPEAEFQDPR